MPGINSWGHPIPKKPSVLSRFRLAGVAVIVGVALVGAVFYSLINSHYLGMILSRTLGPYSDALAGHGFAADDPEIWGRMAKTHKVAIVIEPPEGEALAFDAAGEVADPSEVRQSGIHAPRISSDGTRVIFYWPLWSSEDSHLPLFGGLFFMVTAVVGTAFWFLHKQLKPLTWLHRGVDAVAGGDFKTRVPVVRDDEIGQVAESFNVMAGRVGEMIDDRERLLADVSHELRSPIARMKVALELLPESAKRNALDRDLREMESLISVLLEREELRSRHQKLATEAVDLTRVAAEVVAEFVDQAPGVELAASQAVTIELDEALIRLLVRNLVDNAIKFSQPDSGKVEVSIETHENQVVLRVTDDGVGIPVGSEEQVFDPFVKLDRARGHRVGYGVGLNLCQRIVQLHGGTIELLPRAPRGTEAIVTLSC